MTYHKFPRTQTRRDYHYKDGTKEIFDNVTHLQDIDGMHYLKMEGGKQAIVTPNWNLIRITEKLEPEPLPTIKVSNPKNWVKINPDTVVPNGLFVVMYEQEGYTHSSKPPLVVELMSRQGSGWYELKDDYFPRRNSGRKVVAYLPGLDFSLEELNAVRKYMQGEE